MALRAHVVPPTHGSQERRNGVSAGVVLGVFGASIVVLGVGAILVGLLPTWGLLLPVTLLLAALLLIVLQSSSSVARLLSGAAASVGLLLLFIAVLGHSARRDAQAQLAEGNVQPPPPMNAEPYVEPEPVPEPVQVRTPTIEVEARTLFNDYQANEVAADNRYKEQNLLVTGVVASIDKNFMDDVIVMLRTPNQFMSVHANLTDEEGPRAARLRIGQRISVMCVGGGLFMGSPMLTECVIR